MKSIFNYFRNFVFKLKTFVYLCKKRRNRVSATDLIEMNVIVRRTILYYIDKYPNAKASLLLWYQEFLKLSAGNFNELKAVYHNASIVSNNRVIFNIKGNNFRLIVSMNFKQQAAYVIWFGTHAEYDRIDAAKIDFDTSILDYK